MRLMLVIAVAFAVLVAVGMATMATDEARRTPSPVATSTDASASNATEVKSHEEQFRQPDSARSDSALGRTVGEVHESLSDYHAQLVNHVGVDEADFRLAVISAMGDWKQVKEIVSQRSATTGRDYGELLMEVGLVTGDITSDEIVELINNGTPMSEETFEWLTYNGHVEAFTDLASRGLLVDINRPNPVTGRNAIGSYIQHVGHFPGNYSEEQVNTELEQLIGVGVDPREALSAALTSVNPSNAELMLAMASTLIDQGVLPDDEHYNLLASMKDRPYKRDFLALLGEEHVTAPNP